MHNICTSFGSAILATSALRLGLERVQAEETEDGAIALWPFHIAIWGQRINRAAFRRWDFLIAFVRETSLPSRDGRINMLLGKSGRFLSYISALKSEVFQPLLVSLA